MDKNFVPTPVGTDITVRWKFLFNYIPASEQPEIQKKWADFKESMNRTLEDQYGSR